MKKPIRKLAVFALAVLCGACNDSLVEPTDEASLSFGVDRYFPAAEVGFLTRNVYIGADADAVITALASADPADDFPALANAIETLGKTSFPVRARALVQEIRRTRPHFVGLQEISRIDIELPPLGIDLELDFLAILQAELDAEGLPYVVAGKVENFSVLLAPLPGSKVHVGDFDVLLVDRRRVSFNSSAVIARNYATNIGELAPGVIVKRGFVSMVAEVRGRSLVVANTHLESGDALPIFAQIRAAQAIELAETIGAAERAVILGDLNDVAGSPMHQVLVGAGFEDAWRETNPWRPGFTCCHAADLGNFRSREILTRRLDYIFVRGASTNPHGRLKGEVKLLGELPSDRIKGPAGKIWPSDHAGVFGEFNFGARR